MPLCGIRAMICGIGSADARLLLPKFVPVSGEFCLSDFALEALFDFMLPPRLPILALQFELDSFPFAEHRSVVVHASISPSQPYWRFPFAARATVCCGGPFRPKATAFASLSLVSPYVSGTARNPGFVPTQTPHRREPGCTQLTAAE